MNKVSLFVVVIVLFLSGCSSSNWPEPTHKDHLILALPIAISDNDPCEHGHRDGVKACRDKKAAQVEQLNKSIDKYKKS